MSMQQAVALITGGATGIGAEVARQLASRGARVAICDINEKDGTALASAIDGAYIHCDVADYDSVRTAVAQCIAELGEPAYAHLNAGVMTVGSDAAFLPIEAVSLDQYRRIVGINLDGVYHGLKCLLPVMRPGGGAITITASIAGLGVLPIDPMYAATKYALIGLGRAVAAANADTGLRINVICPGMVDTGIVPGTMRGPQFDMMPTATMAAEVVDLLAEGLNGEVRVKLKDRPGFAVEPPDLGV